MTFLTARTVSTGSAQSASGSQAAPLSITISPTVDLLAGSNSAAGGALNTATSTPLLLVRGESTYSETSFVRPAVKMTPLSGNWADEPSQWETPCSPTPAVVVREPSFESANAAMEADEDCDDEDEQEAQVTLSPMQSSATTAVFELQVDEAASTAAASVTSEPHVYSAFRYNPYSMAYATTELPHCHCLDCAAELCKPKSPPAKPAQAAPQQQVINPYATSVDEPMQPLQPQQPTPEQQFLQPQQPHVSPYDAVSPQQQQYEQYQQPQQPQWDEAEEEMEPVQPQVTIMRFVVPPPPPRIVRRVMSESVDGEQPGAAECVERMYYNALMRWYGRVAEQQAAYFGADNAHDFCPAPDANVYGFDEWAALAGKWWLKYFEHAQKKTTATVMPAPQAPHQVAQAFQQRKSVPANKNCPKRAGAPTFSGHRGSGGFACHAMQQQQQQQHGTPAPRSWRGQEQAW